VPIDNLAADSSLSVAGEARCFGNLYRALHGQRITGVKAASQVAGADQRRKRRVVRHPPVAKRLAHIAADIEGPAMHRFP